MSATGLVNRTDSCCLLCYPPPWKTLLVPEGDLYIHSVAFLWLLLPEGLGISLGYWWVILELRLLPRKGRPKRGTVLGPGAGEERMRVRSRRLLAVEIRERKEGLSQGWRGFQRMIYSKICPQFALEHLFEGMGSHTILFSSSQCLVFLGCNFVSVVSLSGKL